MPLLGRKQKPINNLITDLPNLGIDIVEGNLSVNLSWENHPSGSISIVGILERDIARYRAHFSSLGRRFNIYGIHLEVASYAETKNVIEGPGIAIPIVSFDLAVQLQGIHQESVNCPILIRKGSSKSISLAGTISLVSLARKGKIPYFGYNYEINIPSNAGGDTTLSFDPALKENLRLERRIVDYSGSSVITKNWLSGTTWDINRTQILDSVQSTINKPKFFKRTRLQGKDGILETSKRKVQKEKFKSIFNDDPLVLKPPVTRTREEGDVGLQGIPRDTYPQDMPEDIKSLEGLSLNFDQSGPRKVLRQVTTVNNKVMKEVVKQYGFAYLAEDIKNPNFEKVIDGIEDIRPLLLTNPSAYWVQIEEKTTSYIYKPIRGVMELEAEDEATGKKYKVKYLNESGDSVSTSFNKRYLTEIVTQGWKLGRFQTEQLENVTDSREILLELADDTLPDLDRQYFNLLWESINFRKMPLKSKTSYLLVDPQEYYDKIEEVPFQTQKVRPKDLGINSTSNRELIVATPALDWVYPMMKIAETTQTHAFSSMPNPENVYLLDERKATIENDNLTDQQKAETLKELKLLPELTTGEDSFSVVRRVINPSKFTNNRVVKDKFVEEDTYTEYSYGASNQDSNFRNSAQNIKFSEIAGRPGNAESYPDVYVRKSELVKNNTKKIEGKKKPVYYLNSNPLPKGCTSYPSISVGTSLLSKAIETAKIELSLSNFLSTSQESMSLAFLYAGIRPGDYINSVDSFTTKSKRVKSISFSLQYQGSVKGLGKLVTCSGTKLTLGIFEDLTRDGRVNVNKEYENSAEGLKISSNFRISEEQLGEAPLFVNLRSRRSR